LYTSQQVQATLCAGQAQSAGNCLCTLLLGLYQSFSEYDIDLLRYLITTDHAADRLGSEYSTLTTVLDQNNSAHNELLDKIKRRLRNETFTPDYLREIITLYPELIRALYLSFASYHYVQTREGENGFTPSSSSSSSTAPSVLKDHELQQLINKTVVNSDHEMVMTACRMFNNSGI